MAFAEALGRLAKNDRLDAAIVTRWGLLYDLFSAPPRHATCNCPVTCSLSASSLPPNSLACARSELRIGSAVCMGYRTPLRTDNALNLNGKLTSKDGSQCTVGVSG